VRPVRDRREHAPTRCLAVLALALALGLGPAAQAQDSSSDGLEYKPSLDVPLTLAGVAGTLAPHLLTDDTKTWTCRWCDRNAAGRSTLNGLDAAVRRHWRWSDRQKAHDWSNAALAMSFVAPTSAFVAARGGFGNGFGDEMLIVVEASAVNMALTQGTKYLFRRSRPWALADAPPRGHHVGSRESVLSFVSGHSSLAFAMAVSVGSLSSLRGDEGKEWVWATGLTCAAATSYLRVAADRHYLTDVLAGAALGAAVGWVVPRLFDRRPEEGEAVAQRPTPPVAAFGFMIGGRNGSGSGGVLVTGGMQSGGPYLSATWSF